jgi:hypothetical protein
MKLAFDNEEPSPDNALSQWFTKVPEYVESSASGMDSDWSSTGTIPIIL